MFYLEKVSLCRGGGGGGGRLASLDLCVRLQTPDKLRVGLACQKDLLWNLRWKVILGHLVSHSVEDEINHVGYQSVNQ